MAKYTRSVYQSTDGNGGLSVKNFDSGRQEFYLPGTSQLHRTDGPAVIYANGDKEYWNYGKQLPNAFEQEVPSVSETDDHHPEKVLLIGIVPDSDILKRFWDSQSDPECTELRFEDYKVFDRRNTNYLYITDKDGDKILIPMNVVTYCFKIYNKTRSA